MSPYNFISYIPVKIGFSKLGFRPDGLGTSRVPGLNNGNRKISISPVGIFLPLALGIEITSSERGSKVSFAW